MNRTLDNIIQALQDFDKHESLLHHDQLEISIPQGFYRYGGVDSGPDKDDWDSLDIRLIYYHRELQFSISLMEKSQTPNFAIVGYQGDSVNPPRRASTVYERYPPFPLLQKAPFIIPPAQFDVRFQCLIR